MPQREQIILRYFECRGRAQFLRYFLRVRDIDFVDERIPLSADSSAWPDMRDDQTRTGPFKRLPVLHHGELQLAEAPAIAAFLHRQFGGGGGAEADSEFNLRHSMLLSSLYGDLTFYLLSMIWADLAYPGIDLPQFVSRLQERIFSYLESLDAALLRWRWLDSMESRPVSLADCLLWESLDVAGRVLSPVWDLSRYGTLANFHQRCSGGAVFRTYLDQHSAQITGRPLEPAAITNIHSILETSNAGESA
jgi:glutathione S-transferase